MDNKSYTSTEEFPFPAMELDKDEMFINIRNRNYATFKKEIVTLEQKATFENAKEFMIVIEDDIERFYKFILRTLWVYKKSAIFLSEYIKTGFKSTFRKLYKIKNKGG